MTDALVQENKPANQTPTGVITEDGERNRVLTQGELDQQAMDNALNESGLSCREVGNYPNPAKTENTSLPLMVGGVQPRKTITEIKTAETY